MAKRLVPNPAALTCRAAGTPKYPCHQTPVTQVLPLARGHPSPHGTPWHPMAQAVGGKGKAARSAGKENVLYCPMAALVQLQGWEMGGMPQEVGCFWFLEEAGKENGFRESEFLGMIHTGLSFTGKDS